jgi:glutaredoxin
MKELNIIVYTMKGCPYCQDFKEMLTNEGIEFYERDIEEHVEEYDTFSTITENDMIPALMVIETINEEHKSYLYVPEKNYNELTEAVEILNKHRKDIGII